MRAGARVVYGGNLDQAGFTFKAFRHLSEAYAVRGLIPPFVQVVPEPELRRTTFQDLASMLKEARGSVETTIVLADDHVVRFSAGNDESLRSHDAAVIKVLDPASNSAEKIDLQQSLQTWLGQPGPNAADAYSSARRVMVRMSSGRVVMGARMGVLDQPRDRYEGRMPGILEEAILTLADHQAPAILGAFGGAARDLAIALDLLESSARVQRGRQDPSYDRALEEVMVLADQIPDKADIRSQLSAIAKSDRAEQLSYFIVRILEKWPTAKRNAFALG